MTTVLRNVDTTYIDRLLIVNGKITPIQHRFIQDVPRHDLRVWCHKRGVYQIPTLELIRWLQNEIAGRTAIEIGAGRSCLGRLLGITMVDNYMQTWPVIQLFYRATGQVPNKPDEDVLRMDANEAVNHFNPQVVVGAWITQKYVGLGDGSAWGPDEHEIVLGRTYIHIGNEATHGSKRIRLRPHRELQFPWLVSRAEDQRLNRIWIWDAA